MEGRRNPGISAVLPAETRFLPEAPAENLGMDTYIYTSSTMIGGARVDVTLEVPEEIIDPYPAVVAHGYFANGDAYEGFRNAIAQNGKPAATYNTSRTQQRLAGWNPKHLHKPGRLLSQSVWAAVKSVRAISQTNELELEHEVDGVGHSWGCWSTTESARLHPGNFRTVLLNQPARLEDDSPLSTVTMIRRLPRFFRDELHDVDFGIVVNGVFYAMQNPAKTLTEGLVVSRLRYREKVVSLGRQGVKSAILIGLDDSLVDAERTASNSGRNVADLFAVYTDEFADHLFLQKEPMAAALAQLQALAVLHAREPQNIDDLPWAA